MKFNTHAALLMGTLALAVISGCATGNPHITADFAKLQPRTILVLPPENTTSNTEVLEKSYPFVFSKLAQRGYYAISPELALLLFRSNKLNDPGRLRQLPTQKLQAVFGIDAVLRTRVTEWSSTYVVLASSVNVGFEMELLDARTGKLLWSHKNTLSESAGNAGGGIIGALASAAVNAAVTPYEPIAEQNAEEMLSTLPQGSVNVQR